MIIILRLLHVLSGATWVGALVVVAFFLMPSIGAAGPGGGAVMKQMGDRKYAQFMMAVLGLTILSGAGLLYYDSKAFGGDWFATGMGRTLSIGAALAILAGLIGAIGARPTMNKMQALGAQLAGGAGTPDQQAQMKALQGRMLMLTRTVALLLILAAAAMAVGRYM